MTKKTLSEKLFEEFGDRNDINWSPIIPDGQISKKYPDYIIECSGNTVIVEVKELGETPDNLERRRKLKLTGSTGPYDQQLDKQVRKKIDRAMPQLQDLAKGKHLAVIVLYDKESIIPLEGLEIRLAMYGQDKVDIGLIENNSSTPVIFVSHRFGANQKVGKNRNTTLSAVALLTVQAERSLHLDFYHNKYAAIPFNPKWLRISSVSHYRLGNHPGPGGVRSWEKF